MARHNRPKLSRTGAEVIAKALVWTVALVWVPFLWWPSRLTIVLALAGANLWFLLRG